MRTLRGSQRSSNVFPVVHVRQCCPSSTRHRILRRFVVTTDPPYYDNIGYADLSDFFYVWLRRSLRRYYPELFGTVLTPKTGELLRLRIDLAATSDKQRNTSRLALIGCLLSCAAGGTGHPNDCFLCLQTELNLDENDRRYATLVGVDRVGKDAGWLASLRSSGDSDLADANRARNRMLSSGTNALASSIVLVCRPRPATAGVTDRRGFIQDLKGKLGHALHDLQSGAVAPVDLAQAAIGPGMAVFSSYAKVVEPSGDPMRVRTALALINQVLDEVSAEQEGEFDEDTRWAIAWYAEHGMDDGPFGRADDLSRAKNVSVDGLVRAGLVKSGGGKVRLLDRDELDPNWDPAKDSRLTVWEVTQHLIRRLMNENEASAAELLSKVGGLGDAARDLAYRLFHIAESKKWAKEAGPYNAPGCILA